MNILVIDDTAAHLSTAQQTLKARGHIVTTCSDYDQALRMLEEQFVDSDGSACPAWKDGARKLPYFWDAVLCDLLMPAGKDKQGGRGDQYVGQEMPVGWSLALLAAKRGAKYVAVATDVDHHSHPASAMLDRLSYGIIQIEGAKAFFTNEVRLIGIDETGSPCPECRGTGKRNRGDKESHCRDCSGTGVIDQKKGKDWGSVLDMLLQEE